MKLGEERGANSDEGYDQGDSGTLAPAKGAEYGQASVEKIQKGKGKCDREGCGIFMPSVGQRPNLPRVRKQSNSRSEPHRGSAFDGNPEVAAEWMAKSALARQIGESQIGLEGQTALAIVKFEKRRDAKAFLGRIEGVGGDIAERDGGGRQLPGKEISVAGTKHPSLRPCVKSGGHDIAESFGIARREELDASEDAGIASGPGS